MNILILLFVSPLLLTQLQLFMVSNHVTEDSESIQSSLAYHRETRVLYHQFPGSFPKLSCPVDSVKKPKTVNGSQIITIRVFYGSSETDHGDTHVSSVVTLVYSTK